MTVVVQRQHCNAYLRLCSFGSVSCLAGDPEALLEAARLSVAAECTGEAAVILPKLRTDTAAACTSSCRGRAASNSLAALPVSKSLAENKEGGCKGFAQLGPHARLLGDLIMRTKPCVRTPRIV